MGTYLTQSGVGSRLEVPPGVHHPFLLSDGVFGEPEQLLTGVGGIRTVWSRAAAHVCSLEQNSNAKGEVIKRQDISATKGVQLEMESLFTYRLLNEGENASALNSDLWKPECCGLDFLRVFNEHIRM